MKFNRIVQKTIICSVVCLIVIAFGGLASPTHGITKTVTNGENYSRTETHWPWFYFDGADYLWQDYQNNIDTVRYEGYVWLGNTESVEWQLRHIGNVTLRVDGEVLVDIDTATEIEATTVNFVPQNEYVFVELTHTNLQSTPTAGENPELGLYERSLLNTWQLIPTYRLYENAPQNTLANQSTLIFYITSLAVLALLLTNCYGVIRLISHYRHHHLLWILLAFMLVALALRLGILYQRSLNDSKFFLLEHGSDNYVLNARQTLAGNSQITGGFFSSGNTIWFLTLSKLFGPHLWKLYNFNALIGALSVIPAFFCAKILSGNRAGILAALGIAIFPPLIFYHTTLQIAALNASLMPFVAWAGLSLLSSRNYRNAMLFGLLIGVSTLVRPTTAFVGVAFALALVYQTLFQHKSIRQAFVLTTVVAFCSLSFVFAQHLANRSVGSTALLSGGMDETLLWGNNPVGNGSANRGQQAWDLAIYRGQTYAEATRDYIRENPRRTLELQFHKLGLFLSNHDIENNVSYEEQGLLASPLLNTISLNEAFGTTALLFIALFSLLAGYPRKRELWIFLITSLCLITLATIIFNVFGRMRSQIWPLLIICASVGLVSVWENKRYLRKALALVTTILILLLIRYFETNLPTKQFLNQLPQESISRVHDFNSNIRLIGFDPLETDHASNGYVYLTLYWQKIAQHQSDQIVYVHLVDPATNTRISGRDISIGEIVYPVIKTTAWDVNAILQESYLIPIPENVPDVIEIVVGVYEGDSIALLRVGMQNSAQLSTAETGAIDATFTNIEAQNITVTSHVTSGDLFTINVDWSVSQPVYEDYVWFIHIIDETGTVVAQMDDASLQNEWTTSALIPGYQLSAERNIRIDESISTGTYQAYMGFYRTDSLERLSAHDADGPPLADNIFHLGDLFIQND